MAKYQAVLFATDGDWVTDYRDCESPAEVNDRLADQGSRWFFYPYGFVVRSRGGFTTSRQRIVDGPECFAYLFGRTIGTVSRELANLPLATHEALLEPPRVLC
jgi:hypothetical protein